MDSVTKLPKGLQDLRIVPMLTCSHQARHKRTNPKTLLCAPVYRECSTRDVGYLLLMQRNVLHLREPILFRHMTGSDSHVTAEPFYWVDPR